MHFSRLRLQGFKSFVEPTDLDVSPGLTGIVGPNGCGKSNLVEALRWVMGENSAKRMRGADMDDVIFGGTATRPSRNLAEVALVLDNTNRSATAEFNNEDTLEVTRSIERGEGSDYRINGRPVRQRDVQLLFADQATGAHSTNLVGQGQIDALIRAKPQDRRQILEEASGTAGLHARRHEAELKLKGAEQNLTRVDDVLKAYDTQLRSLKQQVRQATRYRNLADHIRRTEAGLLHLRWKEAEQNAENARLALQAAELRANELLAIVTQGTTTRTEIAAELPELRQTEATAAAIVQKLSLTREQIEAEIARISGEIAAHEQRLSQAQSDEARELERRTDGEAASLKLQAEQSELMTASATLQSQMPSAKLALIAVTESVQSLDHEVTALMQSLANTEAKKHSLHHEIENLTTQQFGLIQRREQLDAQRLVLASEAAARPDLAFAASLVAASEIELAKRQSQAATAEQAYRTAELALVDARATSRNVEAKMMKLKAEADVIRDLLTHENDQAEQVIDLITVEPGFEQALAIALGEALTAALDAGASMHWRALPPLVQAPALPSGITPLSLYVKAPAALERSLSQIGLVDDRDSGERVAADLHLGQIIVSRDGWAWRWDGFTVTPQAKTATAVRLQQRNRLGALEGEVRLTAQNFETVTASLDQASALFTAEQSEDRVVRDALKAAFAALNDARSAYTLQERESTAISTKLTALDDTLKQVNADIELIRSRAVQAEQEQRLLPDVDAQRMIITEKRARLAEQRSEQGQRQSEFDRLTREQSIAVTRQTVVENELAAWQGRLSNASAQIDALTDRIATIRAQIDALHSRPAELEAKRADLLTELASAEARRREAGDRLIETEHRLASVEHQLKQDEASLGESREARVRAEGSIQAASEQFNSLRERISEKLSATPEELVAIAALGEGEEINLLELEETLARFVRERDNMGPVNLRTETEAETLQNEIDKLQKEKDDLVAAIAKLRQGIGQLNKEARERLESAFTLVNERFQVLFSRLFNGGKAHLELIDNEDPLNAGLEIFASPPGKKMQILSLLSGGERTLTALALLFAVFQTNPSPICVLDEAEAALDESNIGRFCMLVEDIAKETGTRFLIITHQRLTMAKMDRLYGVTMSEKGVSQLVSVDLAQAVAIRDGQKTASASRDDGEGASAAETALKEVQAA